MVETADEGAKARAGEALVIAAARGLDAACRFVEAAGDPVAVALAYQQFAQALYRETLVQQMIDAGRRGAALAIDQASLVRHDQADVAARLKQSASAILFNVGANTWPGWGDAGIEISEPQRRAGLEAAMLSLRLVEELRLGPRRLGKAHWLVGAHHIADARPQAAVAALELARQAFAADGDDASETMARGYLALARKLCPQTYSVFRSIGITRDPN